MGEPKEPKFRSIDDLPDMATPEEVAQVLRCSARYIKDQCAAGAIAAAKVANKYLITRDDVRAYLERCKVQPAERRIGWQASPSPEVSPEIMADVRRQRAHDAAARLIAKAKASRKKRP